MDYYNSQNVITSVHQEEYIQNYFNRTDSEGVQTLKEYPDKFRSEDNLINLIGLIKSQERYPIDDYYENKKEKYFFNSQVKFDKFQDFIKSRHFKGHISKFKKPKNTHSNRKILDFQKIEKNVFLTQNEDKEIETDNEKINMLYKKIFEKGMDEAFVYKDVNLIAFSRNYENPKFFEYDDHPDEDLLKATNFHTKYKNSIDHHMSNLLQKQTFVNYNTNPQRKKGLNLIPQFSAKTQANPLKLNFLYETTSTKSGIKNTEIEKAFGLNSTQNKRNKTFDKGNFYSNSKSIQMIHRNRASIDKFNIPFITNGNKTFERNMHNNLNGQNNGHLSKSEFKRLIEGKKQKFKNLKNKIFQDKDISNKEKELKDNMNAFSKSLKINGTVPINNPGYIQSISSKRNSQTKYDEKYKDKKISTVMYQIFEKDDVDFVLKQNKFKE